MKLFNFFISKESKNKNLWLSLLFVLFLNAFWVQEQFFNPTERGSSNLSSRSFASIYTREQLTAAGCTIQNPENTPSTNLSVEEIERQKSIRLSQSRSHQRRIRINYQLNNGLQRYSSRNLEDCQINGNENIEVQRIEIQYEREMTQTECDICDGLPETQTAEVYVIGNETHLTNNFQAIFDHVIENDIDNLEIVLERRSLEEDIAHCVVDPDTNAPYRNTAQGRAAKRRCQENEELRSAETEDERERIRSRIVRRVLAETNGLRGLRDPDRAIVHLRSVIDSDIFSSLNPEDQDRMQARLDIMLAYDDTTQVCLPTTGCEELTIYQIMQKMAEAQTNNDTAALNALYSASNILTTTARSSLTETLASESDDYRNSILGDFVPISNITQGLFTGNTDIMNQFTNSNSQITSTIPQSDHLSRTFELLSANDLLTQLGLSRTSDI